MGETLAIVPTWMHAEIGDEIHVLTTAREGVSGPLLGIEMTEGGEEVLLIGHRLAHKDRVRFVVPLRNVASICVDQDNEEPF